VVHRVAPQVADALWPASIGTAGFRAAFIGVVGALIAYFAHADKRRTTDAAIMRAVVGRANLRLGLKATVSMVLATILQRFAARRALVVVHERASGRAFLWETGPQNAAAGEQIRVGSIEPASVATYQFADQSAAWHAIRPRRGDRPFDIVAIDDDSGEVAAPPRTLPASLLAAVGPFDQLISIDISVRDEWNGRLLLLDPRDVGNRARALDGALRLVRDLVPIVHGVYLLRWLRSRSAAAERARVARELHDGAIQAIMGVHMQLHALSVQPDVPRHLASELNRLTGLLQEQGTALRETMQQLKPLDLGPERLIETLAEIVQRFERETGITARFITSLDRVDLSPRACREVTRVVQEALVNVRKHSGAGNVYVRLTVVNSQWQLSIDDDGRGFPFTGRKSHPDLLSDRQGPVVIGERVRLLGGQLTLQSEPGRGARLEISLPLASHGIET
jgi:signal transduction histidine kinase